MKAEILIPTIVLQTTKHEEGEAWKGGEGVISWLGSMVRQPDGTNSRFVYMFWNRDIALSAAKALADNAGKLATPVKMSPSDLAAFFEGLLPCGIDSAQAIDDPNFEISCYLFNIADAIQSIRDRQEAIDSGNTPVPTGPNVEAVSMKRIQGL